MTLNPRCLFFLMKNVLVQMKPFLSSQLLCCWSILAFLCRRSWGQLSLTNHDPSATVSAGDKRQKEGCFHSSLSLAEYGRSVSVSPFKVTGCSHPQVLLFTQFRTYHPLLLAFHVTHCKWCTQATVSTRRLTAHLAVLQSAFIFKPVS